MACNPGVAVISDPKESTEGSDDVTEATDGTEGTEAIPDGPIGDGELVVSVVTWNENWPVAGAVVRAGGRTATTGDDGVARLLEVPGGRRVVSVEAPGFFGPLRPVQVSDNSEGFTTFVALERVQASRLPYGTEEVEINAGQIRFNFPPGSLEDATGVAWTGPIDVWFNYAPSAGEPAAMPGEPQWADGSPLGLEIYGWIEVRTPMGAPLFPADAVPPVVGWRWEGDEAALPASLDPATGRWSPLETSDTGNYLQADLDRFGWVGLTRPWEDVGCVDLSLALPGGGFAGEGLFALTQAELGAMATAPSPIPAAQPFCVPWPKGVAFQVLAVDPELGAIRSDVQPGVGAEGTCGGEDCGTVALSWPTLGCAQASVVGLDNKPLASGTLWGTERALGWRLRAPVTGGTACVPFGFNTFGGDFWAQSGADWGSAGRLDPNQVTYESGTCGGADCVVLGATQLVDHRHCFAGRFAQDLPYEFEPVWFEEGTVMSLVAQLSASGAPPTCEPEGPALWSPEVGEFVIGEDGHYCFDVAGVPSGDPNNPYRLFAQPWVLDCDTESYQSFQGPPSGLSKQTGGSCGAPESCTQLGIQTAFELNLEAYPF